MSKLLAPRPAPRTAAAIDRAIEVISPAWGARRLAYRAALAAAGHLTRSYEAARKDRRTDGWPTTGRSSNTEIGRAGAAIRNRVRDHARNNPWAANALRKLPAKVIGTGIVPRLIAAKGEKQRRIDYAAQFAEFVVNSDPEGRTDFFGQSKQAAATMFESGEALIRFLPRPASWKLPVPLQCQVIEPDYLDSARCEVSRNGTGAIIQGVEYDADGRRVAYWLFDEHPGEAYGRGFRSTFTSRRVPAAEVLHIFEALRPGQARGVPILAPVVIKLRDIDEFDDAELVRKKIAACFAAFVKREPPDDVADRARTDPDDSTRKLETFSPGMIRYLADGQEIEFATPPSVDGYVEYMRMQLHAVAAGSGLTYEQMTGDLSQVNYSSYRAGLIDFWDQLDCWQYHTIIPQLCRPVWEKIDRLLYALDRRPLAGSQAAWIVPQRRSVDPQKDVAATRDAVRAGALPPQMMVAQQGEDWDEYLDQYQEAFAELKKRGIVLDSDPSATTRAGAPAAQGDKPQPMPAAAGETD